MQQRQLGPFGSVSALTLGGGGIGQVWGDTTREEARLTVLRAVEAGINLLDLAPLYGNGEAERVIGEAFNGEVPEGVHIETKCMLGTPPAAEVYVRLSRSLDESFERMRLTHVDALILHGHISDDAPTGATTRTNRQLFREAVIPAFQRLIEEGRIGAWGITGIGEPSSVIATLEADPAPALVQCITNLLDSPGGIQRFEGAARPREIIAKASARGVGILGIRAVQAGALVDSPDRELPPAEAADFARAAGFRALARDMGTTAAALAHRYALSMSGVGSVVLGVKNRAELEECLAAEAAGPLKPDDVARIDASVHE
ncbi:MAG TPA: aldo/keto reductase [Tepidiformaceae bacterium]|nr:aldo/keto reductase [Tepidiformaceae bacterium]